MRHWRPKQPCVYILASKPRGAMYVGMSCFLHDRILTHKQELNAGYTRAFGVHRLVYYEMLELIPEAIQRETRLKKWHRPWKFRLIEEMNPEWIDLHDEASGQILDGPADIARLRH